MSVYIIRGLGFLLLLLFSLYALLYGLTWFSEQALPLMISVVRELLPLGIYLFVLWLGVQCLTRSMRR